MKLTRILQLELVQKQRRCLSSPNPEFIIDMQTLEKLHQTSIEGRQKVMIVLYQLRIMDQKEKIESQSQVHLSEAQQEQPPS
jgi:hypothetical protein